ncbi:MAG: hypothetical protein V4449_00520 [Patescibacteria group bacterium]
MGNAKSDFMIVILLVIALGIAWVMTGGPSNPMTHQGGLFSAPWPLGDGGNAYTVPTIPLESGSVSSNNEVAPTAPTNSTTKSKTTVFDYFFGYRPGVGAVADPSASPYASYVRLERGNAENTDPKKEYVTIRTSGSLQNSVTITGWALQSTTNNLHVVIGSAAQIPSLGGLNTDTPITLGSDSVVSITTGRSPNGASFRLNMCTGYFEQFQDFSPSLPQECPRPRDEMYLFPEKTAGNAECENFINTLNQCTLTVTEIPGKIGNSCQDFVLTNLSYNGCIAKHRNDPDFYHNEWRVFLGRDQELWNNSHDRILLLDENGKLVSVVSY